MKSTLLESGVAMRNIGLQAELGAMQKEEARIKAKRKEYAEAHDRLIAAGISDSESRILQEITRLDKEVQAPFREAIRQAGILTGEGPARVITTRIDPLNQQTRVPNRKPVRWKRPPVRWKN